MKLYKCDVMEDCEFETVMVVAENEDEAREKAGNMDWSCPMSIFVFEIDIVDGHKITVA